MRVGQFTIDSSGGITGAVKEIRWGGPAVQSGAQFLDVAPKDREKVIDRFLGTFLDNFQLHAASVGNLTDFDKTFTVDYRFSAPSYAKEAGDLIIFRPHVLGEKGSTVLSEADRKYPVEYDEATLQTDEFDFTLPAGYTVDELPPPVKTDCGYISYSSKTVLDVLRYIRTYQVNDVTIPVPKFRELRATFDAIAADERAAVVLKHAN